MRASVKPAPLSPPPGSAPASLAGASARPLSAVDHDASPAGPTGLARKSRSRRIIAVGGGKGGIGKSMVSANLGVALAQAGHKVLLVDADLGGANLHTCLGVGPPESTLSDFLRRGKANLEEVMVATGVPGLSLIAGAQDSLDAANLKYAQKQKLLRTLLAQTADYLILDLGAGTSFNTLDFFLLADHGLLVVLPEPTSVENAYRFVKAAFFRKLQQVESQYGIQDLVEGALSTREGGLRTLHDVVAQVRRKAGQAGAQQLGQPEEGILVDGGHIVYDQEWGWRVCRDGFRTTTCSSPISTWCRRSARSCSVPRRFSSCSS